MQHLPCMYSAYFYTAFGDCQGACAFDYFSSAVGYLLFIDHFTVYCLPRIFSVHKLLLTVHRVLFTVFRILFTVHRVLLSVHCPQGSSCACAKLQLTRNNTLEESLLLLQSKSRNDVPRVAQRSG